MARTRKTRRRGGNPTILSRFNGDPRVKPAALATLTEDRRAAVAIGRPIGDTVTRPLGDADSSKFTVTNPMAKNGGRRRTRRRGGNLRDYVPKFLKKKGAPPMTMAELEENQAKEAERRLGVSTPDRNPIVDKQLTKDENEIRRTQGNHAAYEFGEYVRDKLDKGGRRTKRSKKSTRRRR